MIHPNSNIAKKLRRHLGHRAGFCEIRIGHDGYVRERYWDPKIRTYSEWEEIGLVEEFLREMGKEKRDEH